jgi:hypothetical protein
MKIQPIRSSTKKIKIPLKDKTLMHTGKLNKNAL